MPPSKLKDFSPVQAAARVCDHPDCAAEGEFRAPKSPSDLNDHYWFCLDHVRAYNAAWNYFEGMSQGEIERFQKSATTWHRPTWPFTGAARGDGARRFAPRRDFFAGLRDDVGVLWGDGADGTGGGARKRAMPEERRALAELNLDSDADLQQIKDRYKELVKKFHPDANGGSRRAEERLKAVNRAYGYLLSSGYV